MPAPSVYPGALDDFITSLTAATPKAGHADQHNLIGAAIESVQGELGINPSGGFATLKAKLDFLWDESDTPLGNDVHVYDSGTGKFVAGKVTNAMVDSAAALGISKLAGYPGDATKFLRGDGLWAVAEGVPTGVLLPYLGTTAPTGYLMANGAEVSRTTYAALDAVIAQLYGPYTNGSGGAGSTHLRLPDFQGRVPVGLNATGPALINAIGKNDGRAVNLRNISHYHDQTVPAGSTAQGSSAPAPNTSAVVATSGDANNKDYPAFMVINFIVKT